MRVWPLEDLVVKGSNGPQVGPAENTPRGGGCTVLAGRVTASGYAAAWSGAVNAIDHQPPAGVRVDLREFDPVSPEALDMR